MGSDAQRRGQPAAHQVGARGRFNFFDTANVYSHGESERVLGFGAIRDFTKREDVVIATKVYSADGLGPIRRASRARRSYGDRQQPEDNSAPIMSISILFTASIMKRRWKKLWKP